MLDLVGEVYAPKIKVVHLGVNCESESVNSTNKKTTSFVIATPAALIPHKGHQIALNAGRLLLDRGVSNFMWYFYGDGPLKPVLAAQISALGLENVAALVGTIDHSKLLDLYRCRQIDAVVLTSVKTEDGVQEGIPVSLMEAMAFEIPVIATDSGGTLELIGGGAGMAVPQKDATAVALSIERLIRDSEFRRSQGRLGKIRVSENFNALICAQRLSQLFF